MEEQPEQVLLMMMMMMIIIIIIVVVVSPAAEAAWVLLCDHHHAFIRPTTGIHLVCVNFKKKNHTRAGGVVFYYNKYNENKIFDFCGEKFNNNNMREV